jgi:hypothetical protein
MAYQQSPGIFVPIIVGSSPTRPVASRPVGHNSRHRDGTIGCSEGMAAPIAPFKSTNGARPKDRAANRVARSALSVLRTHHFLQLASSNPNHQDDIGAEVADVLQDLFREEASVRAAFIAQEQTLWAQFQSHFHNSPTHYKNGRHSKKSFQMDTYVAVPTKPRSRSLPLSRTHTYTLNGCVAICDCQF